MNYFLLDYDTEYNAVLHDHELYNLNYDDYIFHMRNFEFRMFWDDEEVHMIKEENHLIELSKILFMGWRWSSEEEFTEDDEDEL